jgi:endonuclease YncB( thermonuclease family)
VPASAQIISGPVTVIDGDTLDMTGTRIRLIGIDAPESKQTCTRAGAPWACGAEATASLAEIIQGQSVTCTAQGTDVYGRTLASCKARTIDIGREMVRRGMAVVRDNAAPDYHDAAAVAQRLSYGLWSGTFQTPADWRAANPREASPPARQQRASSDAAPSRASQPSGRRYTNALGCAIKGNRSIRGEWIYHLPGQQFYDATRPEELFCTEREAVAAGYRRAKA